MQTAAHIVLLICVTLYSLSAPVMWGLYYFRADVIAAAYCVNPDRPSCHGKCHMAKLTVGKRQQKDAPPAIERNMEKPLLFMIGITAEAPPAERPLLPYDSFLSSTLHSGYPQSVYHPPVPPVPTFFLS